MEQEDEIYRVRVKKTVEIDVDVEAMGIDGASDFVNANVMVDLSVGMSCTPGCRKWIKNYEVVEGSETTSIGHIENVTEAYAGNQSAG